MALHWIYHVLIAGFTACLGSFSTGCATASVAEREQTDPEVVAEVLEASGRPGASEHPSSSRAYLYFLRGMLELYEDRLPSAKDNFRRALLFDQDSVEIRHVLADVQMRLGNNDAALANIVRILELIPDDIEALLMFSELKKRAGDIEEAKEALEKVLSVDSSNIDAIEKMAILLIGEGEPEKALNFIEANFSENNIKWSAIASALEVEGFREKARAAWEKAVNLEEGARAHEGLAFICRNLNDYSCALREFKKAIEKGSPPWRIYLEIALVHRYAGDIKATISAENAAISSNPAVDVWVDAAIAANQRGDVETALMRLDQAWKLEEKPEIQFYRGLILGLRRHWREAFEVLSGISPDSVYYRRATVFSAVARAYSGNPENALGILQGIENKKEDFLLISVMAEVEFLLDESAGIRRLLEALSEEPFEPTLLDKLLMLYVRKGLYQEAIDLLGEAIEAQPDNLNLRYRRGHILEMAKDVEGAVQEMKRILEIRPDYADAMNFIGYTWADRGERLEEARQLILEAVSIVPSKGNYLDSLGWVLYRMGRNEEALEHIQMAAILVPDNPEILGHLGDVLLSLGRTPEAYEAYQKALKAYESFGYISSADKEKKLELKRKIRKITP